MIFTPKELRGNVNISPTHPLTELSWLVGGLLGVLILLYILLGFVTEWAVPRMPIEVDRWLGQQALAEFPAEKSPELENRLTALLEALPPDSPLHQYDLTIHLWPTEEINALALPGGHIVVFSGLLKQIQSENELAMILAHELGHIHHRDHLKRLGRGLAITLGSVILFGADSSAAETISSAFLSFEGRYSQKQESAADAWGLDLLALRYGHIGGATDFFTRLSQKAGGRIPYLLASHPHPQARIEKLNRRIQQNGYPLEDTTPVGADILALLLELQTQQNPAR